MERISKFQKLMPLLLLLLLHFLLSSLNYTTAIRVSTLRLDRIQRHLDKINKPAVKSIESPDGEIIDCVHLHNQPALDHPLLKNHKIQMVAPERPRFKDGGPRKNYSATDTDTMLRRGWQAWHQVGECPEGTVPIRRNTIDDVLRAKSLYHYGKKQQNRIPMAARTMDDPDTISKHDVGPFEDNFLASSRVGGGVGVGVGEHAIVFTDTAQEIYGAKATISVWEPFVQEDHEFSLAQIWVFSGTFRGSDINSIEVGWQVNPQIFGDRKPRLFTYWTRDAYETTGCYNLLCSGFVQTTNKIALGEAMSPVSSYSGEQFDIPILVWKDVKMGHWWLSLGDRSDAPVGYWPGELFTSLAESATSVEWGGEVYNTATNGVHTSTQMGSGHFAEEGFGHASYFHSLMVVDSDNNLSSVDSISTAAAKSDCYNVKSSFSKDGAFFYYGGPGRNPNCP